MEIQAVQNGSEDAAESKGVSRRRALAALGGGLGVSVAALLGGCGGSNPATGSTTGTGTTGRAVMTIVWPERTDTRLVPVAANSIVVAILLGSTIVTTQTVARPSGSTTSTVTFPTLPVGNLTVQAFAYPNADGTGTSQASGATTMDVMAGQTSMVTLTMGSTISTVKLIAYAASIPVSTKTSVQLAAYNEAGNTVLITTSTVTFTALNPEIATVDAAGSVTGVAVGTAQFRGIETESGKAATVSITVTAATTPTPTPTATPTPGVTSCTLVPEETDGPYPLYSALSNSSLVRKDITDGKTGVPLTLNLTFVNTGSSCGPITDGAVYIWHCDKDGQYSGYSSNQNGNHAGETFLRGIQYTDSSGNVSFTTIYPGWYNGRITHIHFEVFLKSNISQNARKATSQLAFPQAITSAVYNSTLYKSHGQNTSVTTFNADNVFSDGTTYQMLTVTGDVTSGYVASLVIGVKTS